VIGRFRNWLAQKRNRAEYRRLVPRELHNAIDEADQLVVRSGHPDGSFLFESRDRSDFDELKDSLAIVEFPVAGFANCLCMGEEAISLRREGEETVQLTNHHGTSARCNLWGSDARIVYQDRWLAWLAARRPQ